ncbi:hypothetical protein TCAL_08908 [Tigriopus californicus]|uniref:[histone H3]-lysine(4) N-trimethyltransferase n=1 Tax=Tigriopus californicus TaxID=6832 RepID=A0A553NY75_TIGCA|nr:histone-lysine N-methyltransferase SETD1-like [Tigriopus californicus]TRY70386.1 hypothetical protein TCAL_08908 [Tigriopus californicus]|eukprot:TCALIF_08908-PA protein Name:"Similar to SETD1A Histone-lysine N-methyltransferase SETD1A (Homo sapiens)" AED:0.01 eAED:0.01 QI:570/1/1/1/0.77/0.7/10/1843/1533
MSVPPPAPAVGPPAGGMGQGPPTMGPSHHLINAQGPPGKWHSFKLLVDPHIHRGAPKMVRYDGATVPGNPHHIPPTPMDPRKKLPSALWRRLEPMDLPVPRLKIDEHYIGEPPKVEVTIENLNDNVDQHFLNSLIAKFGVVEEMVIHYHPLSRKHLGLARLVFEQVSSAKACVASLHSKSVMGKCLNCYIDPFGRSCRQMFQDLTADKKPEESDGALLLTENETDSEIRGAARLSPVIEPDGGRGGREPGRRDSRDRRRNSRDSRDRRNKSDREWSNDSHDLWRGNGSHHPRTHHRQSSHEYAHPPILGASSVVPHAPPPPPPPLPPPPPAVLGPAPDVPDRPPPSASSELYQPTSYDPNYEKPEYWLQQAQNYAAAASVHAAHLTQPHPGDLSQMPPSMEMGQTLPVPSDVPGVLKEAIDAPPVPSEDQSEGEHKLDLDTRLKMLMKDKSVPAFLLQELNAESESESEKEDKLAAPLPTVSGMTADMTELPQVFPLQPDEVPLDRAPSPFLSSQHYLTCHKDWLAERRRKIALEMGGVQSALSEFHTGRPKRAGSRNSDQMSLSSLSSGDNNILEQGPDAYAAPPYGYYPPPVPGGAVPPGYPANGTWPPPQGDYFGQYPYAGNNGTDFALGEGHYGHDGWSDPYARWDNPEKAVKSSKDAYRDLIKDSVSCIVKDLKRTLRKDINKRMCETIAFFLFDKWWQEQEEKYKNRNQRLQSKVDMSASEANRITPFVPSKTNAEKAAPKTDSPTKLSKAEDITNFFDKQRENMDSATNSAMGGAFGKGGSLGFSFRGIIPKLPSFKKKSSMKDRKKSAADAKNRSRRDSSDEDRENRPSSASSSKHHKKVSDKLKDHEKRREKRLEHKKKEEQKKRDEEADDKTKPVLSTQSSSNSTVDPKHKKTLSSIYSAIYSASSEDDDEAVVKSSGSDSKPRSKVLTKKTARSKAKGSEASSDVSSSVEDSSSENDSEDEEEDQISVASSGSSKSMTNSSSTTVSSSSSGSPSESSQSSSSGNEEEPEDIKELKSAKAKPKRKALALVEETNMDSSHPAPMLSPSEATAPKPEMTSSETESDMESHVEGQVEPELIAESIEGDTKKKPVPLRRASALTESVQIPEESPPHIMDHCYAKPHSASKEYEEEKSSDKESSQFESHFAMDHGYTRPRTPPGHSPTKTAVKVGKPAVPETVSTPAKTAPSAVKLSTPKSRTTSNSSSTAVPHVRARTFKTRDPKEQYELIYRFLTKGLDLEDIGYLKRSYETMLTDQDKKPNVWVNDTHWVDHTITDIPSPVKKRRKDDFSRPHPTGSCRTEGYYKMDPREKLRTKYHLHRSEGDAFTLQGTKIANFEGSVTKGKLQTAQNLSREARSNQRRQLAILGDEAATSDLLKFNQLKFRRKQMTFGKSAIHDWGLFAMEDIGADEMVIEYVGQVVRPNLSDVREKRYERQGIGSSYLFRIDLDYVVDATKCGNLARFINHSCDPNCYAKVITVEGEKKIVIYSKQPIGMGEEITYDYKFPIEDEKIPCLCGANNCRKYLN